MAWWVIGTKTEAERQELRAEITVVSPDRSEQPEFLPGAGDWKTRRHGLWCNDWLGTMMIFWIHAIRNVLISPMTAMDEIMMSE